MGHEDHCEFQEPLLEHSYLLHTAVECILREVKEAVFCTTTWRWAKVWTMRTSQKALWDIWITQTFNMYYKKIMNVVKHTHTHTCKSDYSFFVARELSLQLLQHVQSLAQRQTEQSLSHPGDPWCTFLCSCNRKETQYSIEPTDILLSWKVTYFTDLLRRKFVFRNVPNDGIYYIKLFF